MKKEALRVSTTIPVAPTTLYFAWLNSEQHTAMTSGTAKIEPNVGSTFSALDGYVSGKLVVLDLGRRIIMSWRTTDFPRDAADSRVEVHLEALGGSTRLTILHTDVPEGQAEKYRETWNDKYFTPMRTYFSKYLPDPREPPPPRKPIPPGWDDDEEEEEEEKPKGKAKGKPVPPAKPSVAKAPPSKTAVAPAKPAAKPAPKAAPKAPAKPAAKAAKKPAAPAKKPAAKPAAKKAAKPAKPAPAKKKK